MSLSKYRKVTCSTSFHIGGAKNGFDASGSNVKMVRLCDLDTSGANEEALVWMELSARLSP